MTTFECELHPYFQPVELPFELPTRFYGAMWVIWLLRPALQRRFPLHLGNKRDYLKFLSWCVAIGRREYKILSEIEAWNRELLRPVALKTAQNFPWANIFNVAMYLAGNHRSRYWEAQIQANTTQQFRAARWYFREGRHLIRLSQLESWQSSQIARSFDSFDDWIDSLTLPKDTEADRQSIRSQNSDVRQAWGNEPVATSSPVVMTKLSSLSLLFARLLPIVTNQLNNIVLKPAKPASTSELTQTLVPLSGLLRSERKSYKIENSGTELGVNLIGYARGELGIGEDLRMVARSLEAAKVPFCIVNIELGSDVSQLDNTVEHWISAEPLYSINIFSMTGIEMSRFVCEQGSEILNNRYNIGIWPWELPKWPKAWQHSWSLVDEIWGISQFTSDSYVAAPVPVNTIPLPVTLGDISNLDRSSWSLPENAYLFIFAFDMNSRITRKNPIGLILAFKKMARNKTADEVGLVLKVSHVNKQSRGWSEIEKAVAGDTRIHIISEELRRSDLLALYRCSDCYVSLHRSEGFGRSIAEAQLLGLSVIATGYSGNTDFCQPPVYSVQFSPRELAENDYFYGQGQYWAEPDTDHAARLMQSCFEERPKKVVYETDRFSPKACGKFYRGLLENLFNAGEKSLSTTQLKTKI